MTPGASATGALVIDTARQVMQGLVRGDLALREATVARLDRRSLLPGLLVAGKMGAKLSFAVALHESHEFLFGLFGENRERSVADIRLRFELRPALSPPRMAIDPSAVLFLPPKFFHRPGAPGPLELILADGHGLTIAHDAGHVAVEVEGLGAIGARDEWPVWLVVALLDTLAAWVESGPGDRPCRFALDSGTRLDKLLASVYTGYAGIADVVTREPDSAAARAASRRLFGTYPGLAGSYRLSELAARVLVQLDRQGDLVTDGNDPDWQQYDLDARMVAGAGAPAIHLSIRPPDVLTDGPFHRAFLDGIREDDAIEQLADASDDLGEESLRDFVRDPLLDDRALFVRIRHDDLDLVLLRGAMKGEALGLLYLVRFEVEPFPDVRVKRIDSARLIGWSRGPGDWQGEIGHRSEIATHFLRLFTVLLGWHRRMLAAG